MSEETHIYTYSEKGIPGILYLELALLPLAFILARAGILGELFPFGLAFLTLVATRFPRLLLFTGLALCLGSLSYFQGPEAYSRIILYITFCSLFIAYPALRTRRGILVPVLILAGEIIVRGFLLVFTGPELYAWVGIVFEGLLAGGLAFIFQDLITETEAGEKKLGLGLLFFGSLLGVGSWGFAGLSLQGVAARAAILAAALTGGAGAGAAVGAGVGFLPSLAAMSAPSLAGMLAFAGLTAGAFRSLGKVGVIGGFFLVHLLLASYFLGQTEVTAALKESFLAAILLALVPKGILTTLERRMGFFDFQQENRLAVSKHLQAQGRAWRLLASELKSLDSKQDDYKAHVAAEIARTVCRGCPASKVCWQLEKKEMLTFIEDLWKQQQGRGNLTLADLPPRLSGRCGRGGELLAALVTRSRFEGKTPEFVGPGVLLAAQYEALGEMLIKLSHMEEAEKQFPLEAGEGSERAFLTLETGFASRPRHQGDICGDTFATFSLPDGLQLLVLSDGMGTGSQAAARSQKAIELLRAMLTAGFPRQLALHTLNAVLLYSSPVESFVTLDLACLDLDAGRLEVNKMGACPSFLRRGAEVYSLYAQSLPLGILEGVVPAAAASDFRPGDVLVMVTDGVLEAHQEVAAREKWIMESLRRALIDHPQALAERLLQQAQILAGGEPRDDMAVAVIICQQAFPEKIPS